MGSEFNEEYLLSILPLYYKRLFPYDQYYKWLSYGNSDYFSRREFSFTFANDIYVRYQSFDTQDDLVTTIKKKIPMKIDIGAIYNIKPNQHAGFTSRTAVEKEIVFDIDMTDYDDVRTCCSGADICTKCWKFMIIACKIIDVALREDFNYNQLLWVFSGRRGIHCWVCDEHARKHQVYARSAIVDYLTLIRGGTMKSKKVMLVGDQLHHSVLRALKIVEPYFQEICLKDQDILGTEERIDAFLKLIPNLSDESLKKDMMACSTSTACWDKFLSFYKLQRDKGNLSKNYRHLIEEIMLQYLYPRLDINVTKGVNHLLKSPFCIHPKSGKISIPFNPATVEKFNPFNVPTISILVNEINEFDAKVLKERESEESEVTMLTPGTKTKIKDYKKTSLYKGIMVFEQFLRSLDTSSKYTNDLYKYAKLTVAAFTRRIVGKQTDQELYVLSAIKEYMENVFTFIHVKKTCFNGLLKSYYVTCFETIYSDCALNY